LLLWFGVAAAVFILLWPAMWVDPLSSLTRVFSLASIYASEGHDTALFFNGVILDRGQSAWYFYPVVYLWRATPVTLLGLGLALLSLLSPSRLPAGAEQRRLSLLLFAFAALFSLFISLSEKKFERYLLPVFAPLDLVAALGWLALVEAMTGFGQRKPGADRRLVSGLLLGVIVLGQSLGMLQTYPYYLNYYNPLPGGARIAPAVMMIGWGEGLDQAARALNAKQNRERAASWYGDGCFSYFYEGPSVSLDQNSSLDDLRGIDFVVLYRDQWQRQLPSPEFLAFFQRFDPEYVVRIGGIEYARIYNMRYAPAQPASGLSGAIEAPKKPEVYHARQ
jgi:4-amino-4-deoxy-L-arabinose transferase-like glycosyltransferase